MRTWAGGFTTDVVRSGLDPMVCVPINSTRSETVSETPTARRALELGVPIETMNCTAGWDVVVGVEVEATAAYGSDGMLEVEFDGGMVVAAGVEWRNATMGGVVGGWVGCVVGGHGRYGRSGRSNVLAGLWA